MARGDPTEQALIRLELRRFLARCEQQEASIRRADSLREISRLATLPIPYKLTGEFEARDAVRRLQHAAECRARELIEQEIGVYVRAEPHYREKQRLRMKDDWQNLTGPLAHLRSWAQSKLALAEQNLIF
ncbi:MAG: hypothetical protein N2441_01165 [Rhodocyclaceae bacterium]|nr:hypothetical protein [Rhodocyclaceae bacterium]